MSSISNKSKIDECIKLFHKHIKAGPTYICTCCQQTWFRESVKPVDTSCQKLNKHFLDKHLTQYKSVDNHQWLCFTCYNNISQQKTPKLSFQNKMSFPSKVDVLNLQPLEERLIALRIPFMQIRQLPRGSQLSLKGPVVNVPTDVQTTINALPRCQNDMQTIPLKLKRKLSFQSAVCTQNVRPARVLKALKYLLQNSDLYKQSNVTINTSWQESFSSEHINDGNMDDKNDFPNSANTAEQTNIAETFFEIENNPEGNSDTLLDNSDPTQSHVMSFAPSEGQKPVSFYNDPDAEYMSFPCLFSGQRRPQNTERAIPVHYSDICKWELRSVDRRVALSVPNLFFKMKKLQIKNISDKVYLAMK